MLVNIYKIIYNKVYTGIEFVGDEFMNIAICDDSMEYINTIEDYLDKLKIPDLEHDVFMSGEELIAAYKNNEDADYDAIFLDMEMGELDGIETANRIRQIDRHVIIVFVTSYKKYMQRSFECMPFRFLLKPVRYEEFYKVFGEVCIRLKEDPETFIFLENKRKTRIYASDIIYFESSSHWILIHMRDGTVHKMRKAMTEILDTIEKCTFVRCHRAFAVNLSYIHQIAENDIVMHNCSEMIPLSKTYKKEFSEAFLNFKERKYLL